MKNIIKKMGVICFLLISCDIQAYEDPYTTQLKNGCNKGNMQQCYELGASGYDYVERAKYLSKACNGGVMEGCSILGYFYKDGSGVVQNEDTAIQLFTKSCSAGNGAGCKGLGEVYEKKYGFWNKSKAKDFYKKSCQLHCDYGCSDYARLNK